MATDDDDTRAKDLDPAQLAELAAWFALPSTQVYEEQKARAADESAEEREWREARERRDAATAAADPAFIDHIFRHDTRPPPFKPLPRMELIIDERNRIVLDFVRRELDRVEQGEAAMGEERSYPIPRDIANAITQDNAPQAILRDLFRPVSDYHLRFESPFDELPDMDPLAAVREALRQKLEIEWTTPAMDGLDALRGEFATFLRASWPDLAADAKAWRAAANAESDAEGR
jgi:hypothetical protein